MLRKYARTVFEIFHAPFYKQPQTYDVAYEIRVKNTTSGEARFDLIVPIPQTDNSQTLLASPKLEPAAELHADTRFGNRYVLWNITLEPGKEKIYRENFSITVGPVKKNLGAFVLSDYSDEFKKDADKFISSCIGQKRETIAHRAEKLRGNEIKLEKIIRTFNDYVKAELSYGNPIRGIHSATEALEKKVVDCGGFDTLLVSLCALSGIPARVVSGFWAGYEKNEMHAWVEILLPDGSWIPADPSVEQLRNKGRTKKFGVLGAVGSDRIRLSVGCGIPVKTTAGEVTLDILQTPRIVPLALEDRVLVRYDFHTTRQ